MENEKYDIWVNRSARYEPTITVEEENGKNALKNAEELKQVILMAADRARKR